MDDSKISLDYLAGPSLVWWPERGAGFYPVTGQPYDHAYWERYRQLDETEMGRELTNARKLWVARWVGRIPASLLDVGIGGGAFVRSTGANGIDVNPSALRWLRDQGKLWDETCPVYAACFWDSLEHIADLKPLLDKVTTWVFVSMPVYRDVDHVLSSKHFRKDEHCWYFTHLGFLRFMLWHGFTMNGCSYMESDLGREDITTYAFRRIEHAAADF